MRPIQDPVETTEKSGAGTQQVLRHPAFGQIAVHHISGGTGVLYGSDFEHQHSVRITISRSELRRDLSHDWHFERETLIEVDMTEVQYAAFVGAPNRAGQCCTITQRGSEMVPGLPRRDSTKIFSPEIEAQLAETLADLRKQREEMGEAVAKLPKAQQAKVTAALDQAIRRLSDSLPFVVNSFNEHIEGSKEKAKVEVEAYITSAITRAGLAAIADGSAPLRLEHKTEGES